MSPIRFKAKLYKIGTWTLLRLPESASAKLPSRALTIIEGNINGIGFKAALEPDGKGSHWFKLDETLQKDAHAKSGDTVSLSIQLTNEWIEQKFRQILKKRCLLLQKPTLYGRILLRMRAGTGFAGYVL